MTETKTLTVRVGDGGQTQREARERIRALERGEAIDDRHVLVLDSEDELQRLLRPTNLELLREVREYEPESMRAAAELVGRDFREVHRNLSELAALSVVELVEEGRSKRPVVRFDEIDIEVSLERRESGTAPA